MTDHSVEDLVLLGDTFYYRSRIRQVRSIGQKEIIFILTTLKNKISRLIPKEIYINTISHNAEEKEGLKLGINIF